MISIARIFIILATLIFSFSSIHSTYANNVYYPSKNNCESGEEAELVDCLRNEVIESTITLRKAEENIRLRINKWSEVKNAALDDAIPIALYRLDNLIKSLFVIVLLSARLQNHGEMVWGVLLAYISVWLN